MSAWFLVERPTRRPATRLILSVTVIAALCGCAPPMPTLPGPVTISFAVPLGQDTEYYFLLEDFHEAYPHISVQMVDASSAPDVFQSTSLPLGTEPIITVFDEEGNPVVIGPGTEIVHINPEGTRTVIPVALPLNLEPLIRADASLRLDDFYPGTIQACASKGGARALPFGIDILVMYYNKDLFDRYGVPYPEPDWTWDDFLDRALTLTDPAAGVFGYVHLGGISAAALGVHVDEAIVVIPFVYQNGGRLAAQSGTPTLDDPRTVEAVEWYTRLTTRHGVAPAPQQAREAFLCYDAQMAEDCARRGIEQGRVAMWVGWLSERGGIYPWGATLSWPTRWGVVALPTGTRPATIARVHGFSINPEAWHIEACWELVSYLSHQLSWRMIPARRSLAESSAYQDQLMVGPDIAALARDSMENAVFTSSDEYRWVYRFTEAIDRVISGAATAEEALTDAQQRAEETLDTAQN